MNDTIRDTQHPVWDVYDLYRDARFSVFYFSEKLNRFKRQNTIIEVVLAITTSTSAVAALWLWDTPVGKEIWQYVLIVSAILAVIKPVINLTEKVQQYEEILSGYRGLESDIKKIVVQIKQSKSYSATHSAKLMEALDRQGELQQKLPEAQFDKKLQEKCQEQVARDLPADHFYVPKDE